MSTLDTGSLRSTLQAHRRFYLFEGWLLIAVGVLAALLPMVTAIAVNLIIAIALLAGGISRLLTWRKERLDGIWTILGGTLFTLAGLLMLVYPSQGIAAFVLVLGVLLLIEGVFGIGAALTFTARGAHTFWLMLSGIASLVLGGIVLTVFPEAGVIYLAVVVGLSFALTGTSLLLLVRDGSVA